MAIEGSDTVLVADPIPANDPLIMIDPIELTPIALVDPLPADPSADGANDVPPDAQTFGGPVDVPTDGAGTDTVNATGDVRVDRPVDPQPEWRTLTPGASTDSGSTDSGAPDAGSAGSGSPDDHGGIIPVVLHGDPQVADGSADGSGDPAAGGATDGSGDTPPFIYEDLTPLYDKVPLPQTEDGTPPMVYTMAGGAVEFHTSGSPASAAEPEHDPAAAHYAVSDYFHSGIALL